MDQKLIRAYKDVFGSAGPATERSDEEIQEILTNNKVTTEDAARVIARKEMSGQLDADAKLEATKKADEEAASNREAAQEQQREKERQPPASQKK